MARSKRHCASAGGSPVPDGKAAALSDALELRQCPPAIRASTRLGLLLPCIHSHSIGSPNILSNGEKNMTVENGVRLMAGTMVLISVVLVYFFGKVWLLLTAFVGLNLVQSAFSGICPAVGIAKKLGCTDTAGGCCASAQDSQD
jgi:hypothetical protein